MAGEKLVKKALDFLRANPELKPYKGGSFSLERQGVYNPKYFDLKKDDLVDEAGNIIASKDVTIPREGFSYDLPAQADPSKIFRGMSAEEFANFQKNNYLQSLGTHNIGEGQKGLTYFSVNPDEARSYAHGFAPSEFKPDPSRPAYVVAAKRPPNESIARVPGTGESEVGVMGQIPREDVTNVYRGNVVDYIEGIHEPNARVSPSSSVHWEEINDYAHGGEVDAALHAVRHHLAGGGFLSDLFSGPDIMSTGSAPSPGDWGNPEVASDFFKADRALRLAREVQAKDDVTGSVPDRAPLTAPRPGIVKATELAPPPAQAFTPVSVEDLAPAPVNIPLNAPERGVPVMGANIVPASFADQPLAYSPEAPAAPAQAAIGKLTARAPQGPDLNDRQRDLIIRTIAAETSGKSPEESQAIAHVILNRIQSGKYGATPEAVLFARKQFEPWSNPNGANYPMRFTPESRRYGLGQTALDAALGAEDITKGATNFWAPKAQAALGRRPPKWGRTGGVDIGETRFHKLERAEGGEVEGYGDGGIIKKALDALRGGNKVFPKPQRMFPADARPPGGEYINAATGEAITGQKPARAVLGVTPEGKPVFLTDPEQVDVTGSPGKGSTKTMTNLFRRSAGWDWRDAPEGYENVPMIVSTKNRNKHYYSLGADYPKGVDLARYPNETSEPRLKPTTQGNVYPGEQVGTIVNKTTGDEHPVYDMVTIRNMLAGTGAGAVGAAAMPEDIPHEAHGGLVDDALHVVREHHADGEAVGQAPEMPAEEPRPLTIYRGNAPVADEAGGSGREAAPAFSYMPMPESVERQAARQPAYNPAERTWSDAGSTEGERLTRALGVEGELPKGETFMSAAPTGWDKYMPQRVPGTYLKRTGEAFNENADAVSEGLKAVREGNYGAGALGMVGGALGAAISPLTGMERVLVRDPYLRMTGNLKDAQAAEMVADAALTGGMRGPAKQLLGRGIEGMATDPWAKMRLPSPAAAGAATAAGAMLAPEDAEASKLSKAMEVARMAIPRELSPLGFYSHGAEAARGLAQAKGTPQQFASMLQKSGVKGPEMEGFLKTFGGRPIVTQEEAAQYFKGAMPQVEERVLGAVPTQKLKVLPSEEGWNIVNHRGDVIDTYPHGDMGWEDATRAARTRMNTDFSDTKFGGYTLPGGENYREVLLKLNKPQAKVVELEGGGGRWGVQMPDGTISSRYYDKFDAEQALRFDAQKAGVTFTSSHWQDPNVLAHLRMADRTGPNGEKILHVEEIQSDWGQQGKKEGFKQQPDPSKETPLMEAKQDAQFAWEKARSDFLKGHEDYQKTLQDQTMRMAERWGLTPEEIAADHAKGAQEWANMSPRQKLSHAQSEFMRSENPTALPHYAQRDAEVAAAQERDRTRNALFAYQKSIDTGIPTAPYVTNTQAWTDLALKRALREAAEGGYDKLVWTPGAEQAKRYDLSKQISNLEYVPSDNHLKAYDTSGRQVMNQMGVSPEKISDYVGKDVAAKLLNDENAVKFNGEIGFHRLSGLDLQTGGEGMKGYYDKIVPNQLSKLVKKLDPEAKIGRDAIQTQDTPRTMAYFLDWARARGDNRPRPTLGQVWQNGANEPLVQQFMKETSGLEVPSLTITPAMREAILKGQTAFKDGGSVVDRALMLVSRQA